ncbi:MAG: NUDIX domain-containing protein [Euryarchaeota archaeon]|nr:NUDIX domain-containing protein [Euryarchaeota archaeon]
MEAPGEPLETAFDGRLKDFINGPTACILLPEMFDIVDADDQVIGQASRAEVHRRRLLHRSVHVYVFNSKGELYLQHRSMKKDLYPGKWTGSASGHLGPGESYASAARRELKEELGVDCDMHEAYRFDYEGREEREKSALFLARHDGPMAHNREEVSDGRFETLATVEAWLRERPDDFAPGFQVGFEKFLREGPALPLVGDPGDKRRRGL